MTARKGPSLLERAAAEARLANEFWLIAAEVAFQRQLMHRITGRSAADVLDWYFEEHAHMKLFFDRHVAAGSCDQAVVELRNDRRSGLPRPSIGSPSGSGFEWAADFRAPPVDIPDRTTPKPAAPQELAARPRGRRPLKFFSVQIAMRTWDSKDLTDMTEERMKATFGASRDVCRKARAAVQSEPLQEK